MIGTSNSNIVVQLGLENISLKISSMEESFFYEVTRSYVTFQRKAR